MVATLVGYWSHIRWSDDQEVGSHYKDGKSNRGRYATVKEEGAMTALLMAEPATALKHKKVLGLIRDWHGLWWPQWLVTGLT